VTSFFGIEVCVFLENDKTDLRQFIFRNKKKHLFITTCIEKQCTRPQRELHSGWRGGGGGGGGGGQRKKDQKLAKNTEK